WFLSNPVTGQSYHNSRLKGGRSFRSIEAITSWCHYVLETDECPPDIWLRILAQLPLRIKAIYDSGRRGYHAFAQIDSTYYQKAKRILEELEPELIRLGACPGSLTPHRLTRLPNCMRSWTNETGERIKRLQRLIYLNPNPSGQPISMMPVYELPETAWLRWV